MKWTGEDGAALSHPSLKSKTPRSRDRSTPVTPPATSTNTDSLFFFQSVFFSFLRKQAKGKKSILNLSNIVLTASVRLNALTSNWTLYLIKRPLSLQAKTVGTDRSLYHHLCGSPRVSVPRLLIAPVKSCQVGAPWYWAQVITRSIVTTSSGWQHQRGRLRLFSFPAPSCSHLQPRRREN